MADKKVTQLTEHTLPAGEDLLMVVDDPTGTPVSKRIKIDTLFGSVVSNTSISGTLDVSGDMTATSNVAFTDATYGPRISSDNIVIVGTRTPTSNNATTEFGTAGWKGAIFWDANYLYIATTDTEIKRVALSTWAS